jgi:hypothetical protein
MSTLDEITKEKQRVTEVLARVDAQREKLASQLSELEAAERVLARYTQGPSSRRTVPAQAVTAATNAAAPARSGRDSALRRQNSCAANAPHRASTIRSLPWQTARRSGKLPPRAKGLARTMSAPQLPGTSGLAASKSAMGNSTPHSRPGRSKPLRSDPRIKRSSAARAPEAATSPSTWDDEVPSPRGGLASAWLD